MSGLSEWQVRSIAVAAAARVLGSDADDVTVLAGADENGKDAYFFTFYFNNRLVWNEAIKLSTEIAIGIVDDLFRKGDEASPLFACCLTALSVSRTMLQPAEFMDVAKSLASPASTRSPSNAELRRSVSTAYYAVFHTILATAAERSSARQLGVPDTRSCTVRSTMGG